MGNALLTKGAAVTTTPHCNIYAPNHSVIEQFRQAMQSAGIHYSGEITGDGRLHRFHIEGHKQGTLNGAYILHLDWYPAGWFMDYTTGIKQTWKFNGGTSSRASHDFTEQIQQAKLQRDEKQRQRHAAAAKKAIYIWSQSRPIAQQSDHQYLVNKRIQPHDIRISRDALVVPLMNESKKIVNLQFISPEGNKRFLSGGKKYGCFSPIGKQKTPKILICEGYATGASLFEETGQCVIAAMDKGNLKPVAEIIRKIYPANEIILCGDNDLDEGGQLKAREAALAIGGKVLIPPEPGMDWNDQICKSLGGYSHHG